MTRAVNQWATKTTWGTREPPQSECLVENCFVEADCEVHLSTEGLNLRYAACSEHGYDITWGLLEAGPTQRNRGFIGLN